MKTIGKKQLRDLARCATVTLVLLSICLLLYAAPAQSNIASFNYNPIDEELSGTVVNCMLQDSKGFLWFGTQIGLYKYNGYNLERYSPNSGSSKNSISNVITSICEDNNKIFWIGTLGNGLFKFDPETGEYTHFKGNAQIFDCLSNSVVTAICKENSGKLWIGTRNEGLYRLDPASESLVHFGPGNSFNSPTITSICKDRSGALWIGTENEGLYKFSPRLGKFFDFSKEANRPGSRVDNNITKLYVDKNNVLWIITSNGRLKKFDPISGKLLKSDFQELKGFTINTICEDNSGSLWIGTYGNGFGMLDKSNGKFSTYDREFSQDLSSGNYKVISLYGDSSGNLWIGTEGNGINKINTNLNFTTYKSDINSGIIFSDDTILSVYKDRSGIIWVGTSNGGINRFDRDNNRIVSYKNNPKDRGSISSNTVNSIYEDNNGTLWFGTIDGTLNKFDPASGSFTHYKIKSVENSGRADNGILEFYEEKDGILWLCTASGGLTRFDSNTGQYVQLTYNPQNPYSISSNQVLSIAGDDSGILWLGTGRGLNKLDLASNRFTHYSITDPEFSAPTLDYTVSAIVNDKDILWLATNKGLFKFDKNSEKSVPVQDSRLTTNLSVFGLLKDSRGNLWLSTAYGLVKYLIPNASFKHYSFNRGLQRNQFLPGAYHKASDGELFFGGAKGFVCFYPDNIKDNTHRPPVVITDFKILYKSTKLTDANQISLTYKENSISFEFAALDYANPTKNQYAYKLEDFDTDWHYSGTRNYAAYTNLDSGEYVFRVKASNNDGLWNEQETQIKVVVTPPFWETLWFALMVFVLAAASIAAFIKVKTRAIKLKSLELERLVAERTRELDQANKQLRRADEIKSNFLSMVSHEIRTPLSAILGFTELISNKMEKIILPSVYLEDKKIRKAAGTISRDLNIIAEEGDRLTALVDNLLNQSKIESAEMGWGSEILNVSELIEQALRVTKPIIEKAGLALEVDIEADLPKISGDREMLTQVLVNLLSNAVKFTREGSIKVSAKNSGDEILFFVEDTGIGIKESDQNKVFERFFTSGNSMAKERNTGIGLGLYLCRKIIEKHKGEIWVESQVGKGSTFYFTIPHLENK